MPHGKPFRNAIRRDECIMPPRRSYAQIGQKAEETMIQLFDHNQSAYQSVLTTFSRAQKTAVIHPTGTGKSFIAFKLAEESPEKNVLWLSPSEKIYRTQLENLQRASGFSPQNITFLTYARLGYLPAERLSSLKPDIIVLDEFHRAGAPVWGKSIRAMLSRFPEAKLLGLSATNIRYLDGGRDMAEELFDNCIADQMSLADAVTSNILTAPEYVISLYACQLDEEKYRSRIHRAPYPVRRQAEQYLDKLCHAIEKAEGLEDVFPRHMPDLHGKYIAFCSGRAHMQEMMRKSFSWFRKADEHPRFYSVWAENPTAEQDFNAFKEDTSDHLRLLF